MKWSKRGEIINIENIPSIIPSNIKPPLLHSILLRSKLEEIQYNLLNINLEASNILKYSDKKSNNNYQYDKSGQRIDTIPVRARDILFQSRKNLIDSIDKIFPIFRIPAALRIAYTKCTRKFYLDSPNMIGLILGPRGEWLKKLELDLHVKISIRGQGSTPDSKSSTEVIPVRNPDEPLHCIIEGETEVSLDETIKLLQQIVAPIPDQENERKRAQLKQLAMYNGVISADSAFSIDIIENKKKFPWEDSKNLLISNEIEEALQNVINNIGNTSVKNFEEEKLKKISKFQKFLIDLKEFDLSMLLNEPLPPGKE